MSFLGPNGRKSLLFGVVLPASFYLLLHYTVLDRRPVSPFTELGLDPSALDIDTISPQLAKQLGLRSTRSATELLVVVISASFCRANRIEGFREAVGAIPELLAAQIANRPEVVTRTVGISVDPDARIGTEYLFDLADFDEVVAGGSWLNTATEKYFWGQYAVTPGIPLVLLLSRTITWSADSPVMTNDERFLEAFVGTDAITEWVEEGAHIPDLPYPEANDAHDSAVATSNGRPAVP